MKDDSHNRATQLATDGVEVRLLARRAIAVLAANGNGRGEGLARRLDQLFDAFISMDEDQRHEMLLRLRQDGVSTDDIIDHIIPAVARLMGERWGNDRISFADVTIGTARLQEAVRALGWHDKSRQKIAETAPEILLVIPRSEHHTLGAFVLADQWRRMGFRVDIAMDQHPRQIADRLRKHRYAMIGITAAGRRTLASARELVDIIRLTVVRATPIFIGGAILDRDIDVLAITGADHTARDAGSALRKCGLIDAGWEAPSLVTTGHAGARHDRR
jgi:methanogenic corrinoid protein MtbC1